MEPTIEQAESVADIVWPELVEEGGAVFIRSGRIAAPAPLNSFSDLLEAECFVNHVHILDAFGNGAALDAVELDGDKLVLWPSRI